VSIRRSATSQPQKLLPTKIATLAYTCPAARAQLAAHYDALFVPFAVGDDGIAEPEPGETLLAVRQRLNAAAERRGWRLAFVRTEGEGSVFWVREVFGA
jgi:hypothetical protein